MGAKYAIKKNRAPDEEFSVTDLKLIIIEWNFFRFFVDAGRMVVWVLVITKFRTVFEKRKCDKNYFAGFHNLRLASAKLTLVIQSLAWSLESAESLNILTSCSSSVNSSNEYFLAHTSLGSTQTLSFTHLVKLMTPSGPFLYSSSGYFQ
ncbi:hypothetical protein BpHYR1_044711 [Brachionus plicatilis]|uniref:Uncharacterized protein n=1 Tax=Brachionus plicatilis TaxID=10195 RepID=A0A3M7Q989_BRAPC|nr:hypothetical protein BpHYR1_044711 [Brachionus plicatilis]